MSPSLDVRIASHPIGSRLERAYGWTSRPQTDAGDDPQDDPRAVDVPLAPKDVVDAGSSPQDFVASLSATS